MSNINGAPRLIPEDLGNGRTRYRPEGVLDSSSPDVSAAIPQSLLGTPEESIAPIAPPIPIRRPIADAQAIQPQAPVSDGRTASMPPIAPEPPLLPFEPAPALVVDPPAGRTPVVPAAPAAPEVSVTPTAPTPQVVDNQKGATMRKKRFPQLMVVPTASLAGVAAFMVLVGLIKLPIIAAGLLLVVPSGLIMLIASVRRAKVVLTDKVKGNATGPVIGASIVTAMVTSVIMLLIFIPEAIVSLVSSNIFLTLLTVIAYSVTLFVLQGANRNRANDSKKE